MNPKSNKANVPLSAPLNLSKLSTEITNFSGWNDINSPYYGKCVSPLYEKTETTTTGNIIYDKSGNMYEVSGAGLVKNRNETVLSYTSYYFTDTVLNNCISNAVTTTGKYIYINYSDTYGTFIFGNDNGTYETKLVFTSGVLVCTKCLYSNGYRLYIVIYQLGTKYYYYLYNGYSSISNEITWYKNTGTSPSAVTIKPNQVRANAYLVNSFWFISILSDSGTGITSLAYMNLSLSNNSSTLYEKWNLSGTMVSTSVSKTSTYIGVYATVTSILTSGSGYTPILSDKSVTVSLTHAWTYPINVYMSDDSHMSSSSAMVSTNLIGTIAAGSITMTASIGTATYEDGSIFTPSQRYYIWISTSQESATDSSVISFNRIIPSSYYGQKTVYTNTTVSAANKEYGITLYGSLTSSLSYIHTPDVIFDDGSLYNLGLMEYGQNTTGIVPFKCTLSSYTYTDTQITINYTPSSYYKWQYNITPTNNLPRSYVNTVIDIGQGFIREMICTSTSNYDMKYGGNLTVNSIICYDSGSDSVIINPGVNTSYRNNAGSLYQSRQFRLLYTNGIPSGISYGDSGYRGTLLSEWYTVGSLKDISTNEYGCTYLNTTDNMTHLISVTAGSNPYQFIENRYIVINTTSYYNCYDTFTDKVYHYADDFNNRVLSGSTSISYIGSTLSQQNMVSAVNANYEISKVSIISIGINPQSLSYIIRDHETFISCTSPVSNNNLDIDIYYGDSTSSYATYYCSAKIDVSTIIYNNSSLQGAYSPITTDGNIMYSPSIFTQYIRSYTNNDMILSNSTGYMLIYSGTTPILAYYLLSGLENITRLFIIQSQFYAIVENKIVKLTYNNGVIATNTAIVDVTGMQFIGTLPDKALFFGLMNKTIYSFTGDCNITPIYEANKIDSISKTYYNTSTQSIYLATTMGLYIINTNSMFNLPLYDINNIFFIGTDAAVISGKNVVHISYCPQTDYTKMPISLTTQYYGMGSETVIKLDSYLIRLYNNNTAESGTIKVSLTTLTDGSYQTDERSFTVNKMDWDSDTGTLYIRYQPKYQACVGASLRISSSFAISSIIVNYTADTEQISKFNI